MRPGLGDTICLVRNADGGERWREREQSLGSGQFTPKGHHLVALLVPDTFIKHRGYTIDLNPTITAHLHNRHFETQLRGGAGTQTLR